MQSTTNDTKGKGAGVVKQTIKCPKNSAYRIELDPTEVFPDDPGAGTPAMVYGPGDASATYTCAVNEGVLDDGEEIPPSVWAWLTSDAIEDAVAAVWEDA